MPQSWVCLIASIELNALFVWFPADTRRWLRDERPLLPPPAQHPTAPSPDLPLARVPSLRGSSWRGLGHRRSEVAFGAPPHPPPQAFSPTRGHGPQTTMALRTGPRAQRAAGVRPARTGVLGTCWALLLRPPGPGWGEDGQEPLQPQVATPQRAPSPLRPATLCCPSSPPPRVSPSPAKSPGDGLLGDKAPSSAGFPS